MDLDYQLAMKLQNEWNNTPKEPPKKRKKSLTKETNGLVDPQWEIVDPNPDIHTLFQVFAQKYFWSKLDSVEVKWSPRMYSCAGICTYKGKWGGCVIALSLPLLKLRPRKDLVETLLHEMIHAYLFVADRNRDRGEHGPKFHEHMYRINKEAGTKITVYHTFHDEVKHYKQHWWRCNGPCQNQKPFFGLVKRSMNRAPGPNDFWYAEHKTRCGGEFTKVKEPEGFKSRKKGEKTCQKSKKKPPESPLAKYFPDVPKHSPPTGLKTSKPKSKPSLKNGSNTKKDSASGKLDDFVSSSSKNKDSVKTIKNDNSSAKIDNYKKISNVHGFTNLSKPGSSCNNNTPLKKGSGFGGTGLKSNMGGTLLLNPKASTSVNTQNQSNQDSSIPRSEVVPFAGSGYVLGGGTGVSDRSKSKLLSLYSNNSSSVVSSVPSTSKKLDSKEQDSISLVSDSDDEDPSVHCPVCNKEMPVSIVSEHLEGCSSLESVFEMSQSVKDEEGDPGLETGEGSPESVNCPVCGISSSLQDINLHLDNCLG